VLLDSMHAEAKDRSMTASKLFTVIVTVAGASLSIGVCGGGAAAQDKATTLKINNAREVRAAVIACWDALGNAAPARVSVRLSFDRDGNVVGQPRITYVNPAPSKEGWSAMRTAVAQAVAQCVPLPLTDAFRNIVAVHPIGVRLGQGWKRRSERLSTPHPLAGQEER
jgi:hypothetical protein